MNIPKQRVLVIDNEDSFTFNLIQLLEQHDAEVQIVSGAAQEVPNLVDFDRILFSPGPGLPEEFPLMFKILSMPSDLPILGICLGMQAICIFYGGRLFKQDKVQHGQIKNVSKTLPSSSLFQNIPDSFEVGLYHSWAVQKEIIPSVLSVTCISDDGVVMGLRHVSRNIEGVQFHPESFLTPEGSQILRNWIGNR